MEESERKESFLLFFSQGTLEWRNVNGTVRRTEGTDLGQVYTEMDMAELIFYQVGGGQIFSGKYLKMSFSSLSAIVNDPIPKFCNFRYSPAYCTAISSDPERVIIVEH